MNRLPFVWTLLVASAFLAGCDPAPTEAPEPPAEEEVSLTEAFRVTLDYAIEGEGPFDVRRITNGETEKLAMLESHFSVLQAEQSSHAPHTHRAEEIIFPIQGDVEIYRGPWEDGEEERVRVGPGQFIFHASNHIHAMSATGPGPSGYWVMQWEGGPTGADEHILPPSTFDYREAPAVDEATGVGREALAKSQTPNIESLLIESVAVAAGAEIPAAVSEVDTVMLTLTEGLEVGGEAAPRHTVIFYPAGSEFGITNSTDDPAQLIQFTYGD